MRWQRTQRRLRDGARLDTRGLSAIAQLPGLVSEFNAHWTVDMFLACKCLRPSRFDDKAADVEGLVHHLAVLCAIASGDDQVAATLCRWQDSRDGLLAGTVPYAELEHLRPGLMSEVPMCPRIVRGHKHPRLPTSIQCDLAVIVRRAPLLTALWVRRRRDVGAVRRRPATSGRRS
jgi:hypothetical protein